jgi:hypothetical protein
MTFLALSSVLAVAEIRSEATTIGALPHSSADRTQPQFVVARPTAVASVLVPRGDSD